MAPCMVVHGLMMRRGSKNPSVAAREPTGSVASSVATRRSSSSTACLSPERITMFWAM